MSKHVSVSEEGLKCKMCAYRSDDLGDMMSHLQYAHEVPEDEVIENYNTLTNPALEEYRVLMNRNTYGLIRERIDKQCPKCYASTSVLTFGLECRFDVEDNSEVFFWCECGHKWIEEPKPKEAK